MITQLQDLMFSDCGFDNNVTSKFRKSHGSMTVSQRMFRLLPSKILSYFGNSNSFINFYVLNNVVN